MEFNNECFKKLVVKMERWYDVKIQVTDSSFYKGRLSGKFNKETIEQALEALTFTVPFKYKMIKNEITIYK